MGYLKLLLVEEDILIDIKHILKILRRVNYCAI